MGNCIQIAKRIVVVLIFSCSALVSFGEGSISLYPHKESGDPLFPVVGNRAWLISTTEYVSSNQQVSLFWPNPGRHYVYALPGEVIHVGSSAQGLGAGTINIWSPTGEFQTTGSSTTIGVLNSRVKERVGPSLTSGDGGYTSYNFVVPAGQGGLWRVEFRAPVNTGGQTNAGLVTAGTNWTAATSSLIQSDSRYILAWDVTVVSSGIKQTGRVFQTAFTGDLGSQDVRLCTITQFHVLSKDGYQYLVEPTTGFQPWLFAFFANNKGLRHNTGANVGKSAYVSADNTKVENATGGVNADYDYHIPTNEDDASNVTHKIFYHTPSSILPATAPYYLDGAKTTWLRVAEPVQPTLTNLSLVGVEGTSSFGTGALSGGYVKFDANIAGAYRIMIDANNDGDYTDAEDVILRGDATSGSNSVRWDGKNGTGTLINSGTNIQVNAVSIAGEVHFPLADAEKNIDGIRITRLATSSVASSTTVYWDDRLLSDDSGVPNPKTNTDVTGGQNSTTNGHKWGLGLFSGGSPYGDQKVMDTWTNVLSSPQNLSLTITTREANLEIVSLTGNLTNICVGTEVTYTFVAKNNGPNNSGDATVSFVFPSALTNLSLVSATVTTGTATGVGGTFSGTTFTDVLNMDNGAIVTYVVKGTIGSYPSGGNLNTSARILRAADVTDPDATNDDTSPPTDPVTECNGSPSGAGCNNIKDLTTTVQETPSTANAGSNQSKCNDGNFTMAATTPAVGSGTWSVVSGTATITSTTLTNTTVTGVPVGTTATLRWTVSNGTCTSTTADVTLTNNASPSTANAGSNQSKCNDGSFTLAATTPTVGTGTWSVVSGTATITNATLTNTTITGVPVGTTATLRWTVSNGTCTATTADITLTNNNGPSGATLTTAATLTNCNNGTFNIGAVTPTLGTGQWSLISGTATITNVNVTNTTATGIPTGTSAVLRWTVSSAGCTSNITDVTLMNNASPSAANAGSNQTKCNDGSFTLAATTPTVGTGTWSVVSGTATITNANLTNTTVTGVPVGTTVTLRWTVSNGTCTATTADITLTNNALPSTANAGSNQSKCNDGSFTLAATTPTIGTGTWSVVSGTATITNANLTNTTVTGVPVGTTATLRWTVSNGTCTSTTADITLTNNALPSTANAGSNQSKCNDGSFTLAATTPAIGTGTWSVISGTATITNANLTNTGVTGVSVGTTATLRWTVSNGTCTETTADITLTNNALPSTANAGSNQSKCNDGSFTLAATTPIVGTGTWSVVSGTATITNANLTNTGVTGVPVGTTVTLRWTVSNGNCTATSADITLTNSALPSTANAGSNQTKCNDGSFTLAATTPAVGTGTWSVVSGTATITNTNLTNTTVTGVPVGTTVTLRWTVSNGTCTATTADITLTNSELPSTANAGSNQSKCNDGSFTMAALTPAVGSGTWSVVSGTATITNTMLTNTTVTGVPVGTTATLRWTVSNGTCTSTTADVTLTNSALPSTANAGSNQTKCNDGSFTLAATTPTVGTGTWSVVSGTATITNANLTNTTVTGVPVGTTVTLRWTVSNGTCTATTADITLTNNNGPSAAALTTAATLTNCNNGTFNIGAVTPTLGTGQWSLISGTATITNANATSTTATGIPVGTSAVLRWTVSSAGCTSNITDVTLTNNASPSAANAGSNQTKCNDGSFTLAATTPTVGTGAWSVVSGTATITNTTLTNTTVTGVPVGTTVTLRWTVSNGTCTATTADIILTNSELPSTANAGSNQSKCNDGSFTLAATTPAVGTGTWSVVSGTATITNANLTNTGVTGVPVGTTATLRWTVSNGTCTSTTADVTLTNSALPSTANAGSNQTKCNDGSFTLAATTPAVGTGTWSVVSGTATITNTNLTNTTVTGVPVGTTTTLRWTVSNGTCTATTADITLTNNNGPSAATLTTAATITNCDNGTFNIGAVTPTLGTGQWSLISGTATITNANATSTTATGIPAGTSAVLRWTVSSAGCTSNITDLTLVNNASPSVANAGSNQTKCNDGSFTLAATTPAVGTGTWSVVSGTATITNTNLTNTTVTGVPVGTTATLRWTVSNGTCTSTTADVTLTNNALPSTANAGSNQSKCNDGSFTMAALTPAVGTGTWSVLSGTATITNTNLTNTTVTGVPVGTTATLRWTVSNGTCTSTTADVTLTNSALPSTANAGSNQTKCNDGSFTLAATTPTVGTGTWSVLSGTATITNANLTNTTVTGVPVGTTATLRWTVSNGTCTATTADITLTNNTGLSAATLTTAATLTNCDNTSFNIGAVTPTVGTGQWSLISGTATITNANATSTTATGIPAGTSAVLRWTVSNAGCTSNITDVTLVNNASPSAANAGSNQTKCNDGSFTMAATTPAVGTGTWSVVSGTATITNANLTNTTVTGVPVGTTATLRWTVSNGTCTATTADITLTNNNGPSAATLTTAATLTNCDNTSFNIGAVTPTVGTGQWSLISGTATITNVNVTSTTVTGIAVGTSAVIRWTVSSAGCSSTTVNVTLTNNALPSTANAGSNQTKCNDGSFTLAATTPAVGTGTWSVVSGTATITNANLTNTTVTGVPAGTTATLRWTVSNGTCTSTTADITLTNNNGPSAATLTTAATLTNCDNTSFNIGAVTPTVGTGQWSLISGTATITNANATSTTATGIPAGTSAVLRWTVSNAGCTSNITDVTLVNNASPSAANAGSNQTKCNDGSFTMAATTPAVGTGTWSVVSGTATITNANLTNTTVTGVPVGTTVTLRWTVSNGTCTSTTANITLTNQQTPSAANAGSNQSKCIDGSFTLAATTPTVGTGTWSVVSGTATITTASLTNTTVTGVPVGTTATLRWTVSNGTCTSTTADITLTNSALPSTANAGSNQTKCNDGSFTMAATTPAVGTGTWSVVSGTATITNVNLTNTTVTGVPVGTTATLRWTVSNGTCTATTANVTLTNNALPSTANAGSNQSKCNDGNFTLAATTPAVGTGTWSVVSGTATITTASLTNTTVTGVPVGTTATLRWTVSNGTCTSTTADITLTNSALPSTANAGSNQTKCNDGSFTMAATTPAVGTGTWSVVSGTATITNVNLTNTTVTGVPAGTTVTLRWTVSNGTCTSTTANITLTNQQAPSTANAGSNQSKCNDGSFTLAAATPAVGTGTWSVVSGTATISNANLTNTTVTGVAVGSVVTLRWTVSNGTCSSSTADITLTNNATPSTANAGANIVQCNNSNFTLAATTPTIGSGVWSVVSGSATITNASLTNTTVTSIQPGTTVTLRWTVSNGTCTATTSDIDLTNNPAPSTANAGTNQTNCNNDTFTLSAVTPSVGNGVWSLISGTATINNINLTNTTVTGIIAGYNATLRWTVSASGCTSNSADIVLSNQNPPSTAVAGSNQIKCNDGVFTMAATTPIIGTGVWSIVSGSATIMSTTLTNTTISGIPLGSSTTLRWTVTHLSCPASTADVVLTNTVSVNAGSDITISCSTTAKLSAAVSGQTWTAASGNPSSASINNNGEITGMVKKGNYFFTLSNSNCSATVKVTKANCPPVALNDTQTVRNDQVLRGTLSPKASDTDGDVLTFSVLIPPTRGTITFNKDGSYVYTPPAGYVGTDSITYRVCDVDGLCADAKLYIQVTGPPLPPIAVNDSASTIKNQPVRGNVLGNDRNAGTNNNTGLILNLNPVLGPSNGSVVLNSDGSYTYTPANNFVGLDSFRYVICNAASLCDTATVYITVSEPPQFQPKLSIEKRVNPSRLKYGTGEIVTYTLVAKNTGNIIVNDISVQDILPPATKIKNVRMVQGTPNAGLASYEPFTNVIFWTIPFLHIGDSAILKYTMVLSDSGTLVNTATISSLMINGTADTATISIDVVNQADIKITKLLRAPAVISVNDEIGFTMIAENFGPAVGTEVVIQDSLYANLSDPRVMTVNIGKVSFDPLTRKITWRIDTLLVGQKDSLVIRVKIISGGEIRNGATVKAKQTDPVSGNNGAVVTNITGGQVLVEGRPFFIPSVFTPNGDGKNDKFTILGINQFPGSELIIYNRWGNVVYQSKDYKNDWDGRGLNEGTYYYTLNLKTTTGSQRMAGWVEILR